MDELTELRARLDRADAEILAAIEARFAVIRDIAEHKRRNGVPMMQPARVSYVQDRYAAFGDQIGVTSGHLRQVAASLIAAACDLEDELMAPSTEDGSPSGHGGDGDA